MASMNLSRIASVTRIACHGYATRRHKGRWCPTFDTSCCTWSVRPMMATVSRAPCSRRSLEQVADTMIKATNLQIKTHDGSVLL